MGSGKRGGTQRKQDDITYTPFSQITIFHFTAISFLGSNSSDFTIDLRAITELSPYSGLLPRSLVRL
jgi:hypothetical protein